MNEPIVVMGSVIIIMGLVVIAIVKYEEYKNSHLPH